MSRLPTPGGDNNNWGDVLNDYLSVELNSNGTLKKAGDITTALNTANSAASTANSAQSTAASAVQSVNGKAGTSITLAASDVSAVASSQIGANSGVASLDSGGKLTTAQRPGSTVLHGNGAPSDTLGNDGDVYIDDAAHMLYGPKGVVNIGLWGTPVALGGESISVAYGLPGDVLPQLPDLWSISTRSAVANRGYFLRYRPPRSRGLSVVRFEIPATPASGDDPVDIGLYSASGTTLTRLQSLGSTNGLLNSTGIKAPAFVYNIDPTITYYLAIAFGTVSATAAVLAGKTAATTNTPGMFGATPPNALAMYRDASFPLPSSVTSGLNLTTIYPALYPSES